MSVRLPYAILLVLLVIVSSPLWIIPFLQVLILGLGELVWITVMIFESLGALVRINAIIFESLGAW